MKTRTKLSLVAAIAAALSLNVSTTSGQVFDSVEVLNNRAVAASPRAKEMFPWLTRRTVSPKTPAKGALADVAKNRAFPASPRTVEEFPELVRPAQPARAIAVPAIKNRALAASPRAKEEFPWLTRGNYRVVEEPFQISPLK